MVTKEHALIPQAFIGHIPIYQTGETNMKQTQTLSLKREDRKRGMKAKRKKKVPGVYGVSTLYQTLLKTLQWIFPTTL